MSRSRVGAWRLAATLVVVLLPLRVLLPVGGSILSPGVLIGAGLMIFLIPVARQFKYFSWIAILVFAATVSVPLLQSAARADHSVDPTLGWAAVITLLASVVTLTTLLWARTVLGVKSVAIAYSIGLIAQTALTPDSWSVNAWKFGFAFPVVVLLLALTYNSAKRPGTIIAILAVALASISNDHRSYFGFAALAGLIFLWRWNRDSTVSLAKAIQRLCIAAALGVGMYFLGVWLALQGYLGERNQLVTSAQIDAGGSVLAAGRIESGAALRLFVNRPLGYGAGVIPNSGDLSIGQAGLVSSGVDIHGAYVRDYLFGEGIKLHSVVSDLWVGFGLAGLALGLLFAFIMIRGLLGVLMTRTPPALPIFLVVIGIWDLLFSPIGSNLHEVIFAVALIAPLIRSTAWFDRLGESGTQLMPHGRASPPNGAGRQHQLNRQ